MIAIASSRPYDFKSSFKPTRQICSIDDLDVGACVPDLALDMLQYLYLVLAAAELGSFDMQYDPE